MTLLGASLALDSVAAQAAPGPEAAYSFDAGSGSTVADLTGNEHTGTIEEGEWAKGRYGGAIAFKGGGKKCVSVADAPDLHLSEEFTLEAWVRAEGGVFGDPVVVKDSEGETAFGLGVGSSEEGMAEGFIGEGKESSAAIGSEDEVREYAWTHIAATYDGAQLRIYVNGELAGSEEATTPPTTGSGALRIGCDAPDGQFTGRIDEVRIYGRTLSEKELQRDMATPLQTPQRGPVATYSFDKGEGETAEDTSGNGHTAALEGPEWTPKGKYGSALEFDAPEDDVLKIPDASQLDFTEEFTLEAWVRPSGADNHDAPLIAKQAGGGLGYFLYEGGSESDRPAGAASEEHELVVANEPLDAHAWSHVALTFDGDRTRLYVNGEEVANEAGEPIVTTEGDIEIGGSTSTSDYFDGRIDEVRLYDRVLSEAEVQSDKATPLQATKPGPLVEFSFDQGEGETVEDTSGHDHDATIEGAEWSEGKYGGSLKFNGEVEDMLTIPASEELNLTEEFTLEAWIKPEAESEFGHLFVKENAAEDKAAYVITKHTSQLGAYLGEPEVEEWTPNESLRLGVWQHAAVTYDGARIRLYINGHLEASELISEIASTDGPLRIGGSQIWGAGNDFTGKIDRVQIYGRALDHDEIEADKSPRDGPVAAYTLNENEGTTTQDISGNGHTGAIEGAEWTEGKYGRALDFDGESGDNVAIPASEELDLTDEFTLEAWVRPEAEGKYGHIFIKENAAEDEYAYRLTDRYGQLRAYLGDPQLELSSEEGALPLNTWSYVTVTDSGYHVRLYVNGVLVDTEPAQQILGTDGPLRIGASRIWGASSGFSGKIDEPRVYDRALTADQIEADMHNDFTAPEIELSGTLTEGLKEGTTEFPLHVHAVDGKAGFPGVGVKSITISVDGEVVDHVEQECAEGNCSMDREWTFKPAAFEGEDHYIDITAADVAGNQATRQLAINPPDGSIPACSPLDGSAPESTPDEVKSLPGGGTLYIYDGAEGEKYEFPEEPSGFNPLTATNEELAEYGYPPRPSNKAFREDWESVMKRVGDSAPPGGCISAAQETVDEPPTAPPILTRSPNQSGYLSRANTDRWVGAHAIFHQPGVKNQKPQCKGRATLSSWVGLGGGEEGFFQAGTQVGPEEEVFPFMEKFFAHQKAYVKAEHPFHPKFKVSPSDEIFAQVEWKAASEKAYMFVANLDTHKHKALYSAKGRTDLYNGEQAEFIGAERNSLPGPGGSQTEFKPTELLNYGRVKMNETVLELAEGGQETPAETSQKFEINLHKLIMQNVDGSGNVMSLTSELGAGGKSFTNSWHACHP